VSAYQGTEGTRPYAGAGWYYAEYRPRVSRLFAEQLAAQLGWSRQSRILDLGAGPAQLALRVAPLVAKVVAIDIEPDMLSEGQRRAQAASVSNIQFVLASSAELAALGPSLGMFHTVLMGSSFHWMLEKDRVLRDLSAMVDPLEGSVAFITTREHAVPGPLRAASETMHAILDRYLADVAPGPHPNGRHDPYEEILARSPFPRVEQIEQIYEVRVRPTVAALVGAEYSMSHVLTRLGGQRAAFEQEVRAALPQLEQAGEQIVTYRDEALIGRR
jgi:ubiquinone/menaquinone biosynthesis C-methylase UbiE